MVKLRHQKSSYMIWLVFFSFGILDFLWFFGLKHLNLFKNIKQGRFLHVITLLFCKQLSFSSHWSDLPYFIWMLCMSEKLLNSKSEKAHPIAPGQKQVYVSNSDVCLYSSHTQLLTEPKSPLDNKFQCLVSFIVRKFLLISKLKSFCS